MSKPDFSDGDRQELRQLGLCAEQVEELRFAITWVRLCISPPASTNKTKEHLLEIKSAAKSLRSKLDALERMPASDYQYAAELLDERGVIVPEGREDLGLHYSDGLRPHLENLLDSTDYALQLLSTRGPARSRTGDPRPIKRIETALITGWAKAHGPVAVHVRATVKGTGDPDRDDARLEKKVMDGLKKVEASTPGKPYPSELLTSSQAFKDVVRVVYRAAGYTKGEPKRAIENFIADANRGRREVVAGMTQALDALAAKSKRRKRTPERP